MPTNIGENRVIADDIARVSEEDANRLSKYRVRPGDIVYSRRGDVEKRALITKREDGWLCGTGCLRVRFGDDAIVPRYAAFYLAHPEVRRWIVRHAQGATMPNLNTSILSECPFLVPPEEDQEAIAHILGTLDDKIKLNRRMSRTLEEMARALFKSWFVDFDPVRAKIDGRWKPGQSLPGLPAELYDLFPDRLVESELGVIPEGWSVGTLGEVANCRRETVAPNEMELDEAYISLQHMPRRSITLSEWASTDGIASNKSRFSQGDILFGKLRPYFHKVGVAPTDGLCSTDVVVVYPAAEEWLSFVLGHLSSTAFVDYTSAGATGTKMPRTSWKLMAEYRIAMPDRKSAEMYNLTASPLTTRIVTGIREGRQLISTRDAILPSLVAGALRIGIMDQVSDVHRGTLE